MAYQIRVSPDALRNGASDINSIIEMSDVIYANIKMLTHKLDSAWDGAASRGMVAKLEDLLQAINKSKDGLQEDVNFLESVAQRFEAIDNAEENSNILNNIRIITKPRLDIIGPGGRPNFFDGLKLSTGNIRVVPEELRQVAEECKSVISDVENLSDRITKIDAELKSTWEGKASNRFSESFTEMKTVYMDIAESIQEFADRVAFAANRYEEIDNIFSN